MGGNRELAGSLQSYQSQSSTRGLPWFVSMSLGGRVKLGFPVEGKEAEKAWAVALVWRPWPCAGGGETRLASRWSLRRLQTSRSLMAGVLLGDEEQFPHKSENS